MAELQFFATESDHSAIVEALVREYQAVFQVDAGETASAPAIHSTAQVLDAIAASEHGSRFFITSPRWTKEPLQVANVVRGDGKVVFHFRGRYGGPSIDYIARRPEDREGQRYLVSSSVGTFDTYYLADGDVKRPSEVDEAFGLVRRIINRGGRRTDVQEFQKPGPVAMKNARLAYETGCWLRVGSLHHVPRSEA